MKRIFLVAAMVWLGAFGAARAAEPEPTPTLTLRYVGGPPPPTVGYGALTPARGPASPEAARAAAAAEMVFTLERGPARSGLPRWRMPTLARLDPALEAFSPELERLIAEIRERAGLDLRRGAAGRGEGLHIRVAPTFAMMRRLGGALCVATPGDVLWSEFEAQLELETAQNAGGDWASLVDLTAATIFLPDRARPYQVRACLNEEVTQALGPAGDFFAAPYSSFNDDGAHSRPTEFDFYALALAYRAELRPGMSKSAVLDALGAAGRAPFAAAPLWLEQLRAARAQRHPLFALSAYDRALRVATELEGAAGPRALFTALEAARMRARIEPRAGRAELAASLDVHRAAFGAQDPRIALIELDIAESLLGEAEFEAAAAGAAAALPVALGHALDDQIARSHLIRVAAAAGERRIHSGQPQADAVAEAWRLYAFGEDQERQTARRAAVAAPREPASGASTARAAAVAAVMLSALGAFWLGWRVVSTPAAARD